MSLLSIVRKANACVLRCSRRPINATIVRPFFEPYRKGDEKYEIYDNEWDKLSFREKLHANVSYLKEQFALWKEEVKEHSQVDPKIYAAGDVEVIWKFDCEDTLKKFVISCDSDWNEGDSSASLELSKQRNAVFHGILDTSLPKDGSTQRAGWVNITTHCPPRSFNRFAVLNSVDSFFKLNISPLRSNYFDWEMFTHLVMRIRGDGRNYAIILRTPGYFDITWMDFFTYILYTHGGPYWQNVRIPFSKFIFAYKGRAQDEQIRIHLHYISSFGITLMDNNPGPFNLEIDYIGVEYDPSFTEESAYEMYRVRDAKWRH
ncbi:complex I intermediate-associated protein 30-like protein [Dinothrombium tinctorium]|uniref:Complex I intermediate-associated protein 30-like protein n=1 Tax=Dinothrombium tinctorium TaxID=1965070 RepID=A0A443QNR1_9ACAR|nr:complex I intermediate-associated protein 30-like protein [Dinothrombium tinctorium]